MKKCPRIALILALGALVPAVTAASAIARSGFQVFSSGLHGVEARATLNHRALTIDKWSCHYGTTFGPTYEVFQPNQGRIKVSSRGRFNTHIELPPRIPELRTRTGPVRTEDLRDRALREGQDQGHDRQCRMRCRQAPAVHDVLDGFRSLSSSIGAEAARACGKTPRVGGNAEQSVMRSTDDRPPHRMETGHSIRFSNQGDFMRKALELGGVSLRRF